uniref:Uncharacterized protein n=1 Tax=Onchocerca volvulus TaxID=6282 RepID=A0A8R1XXP0_ONCVO
NKRFCCCFFCNSFDKIHLIFTTESMDDAVSSTWEDESLKKLVTNCAPVGGTTMQLC